MNYKNNVSCSETSSKMWTRSALDCYLIGCICSKCYLYKVFFSKRKYKCRMKEAVIKLVRQIGVPKNRIYDI